MSNDLSGPGLLSRLRRETSPEHAALERDLAVLSGVPEKSSVLHVLKRFHGFHKAWEPALALSPIGPVALRHRRLDLLAHDLQTLGVSEREVSMLAPCRAAAGLTATRAKSLGSLYVMEGSTLGGQVINHALRRTFWAPPGGLRYFNPYGKTTAARWKEFIRWLEEAGAGDADEIVSGAQQTFSLLRAWIAPPPSSAGAAGAALA